MKGVEKVYALQAGREVRVIVKPEEIDDDEAVLLSHEIAREIEEHLEYPGQIKVTVIRESARSSSRSNRLVRRDLRVPRWAPRPTTHCDRIVKSSRVRAGFVSESSPVLGTLSP